MNANRKSFPKIGTGTAGLLLLLAIVGAVVVILGNLRLRHDFTADKLYTLSAGSKAVLAKLPNDVTLKFYFNRSSEAVPMFIKSYARQVEDLLKEYELAGRGRLTLEVYDPKPDSDDEEWAQRYGIQGQPTGMFSPPLYFGLVAVSGEREETLPALTPQSEATLEYDLTRLISRVATAVKPVIGVLSALPVMGEPNLPPQMMMQREQPKPWFAIQELQRDFDVRSVPTDSGAIDAGITTLVVVHPKNLTPKTLFAIDQFVMRGGRLIACVDPLSLADLESSAQNPMAMYGMGGGQGPSTLEPLFAAWGVGFDTAKLVADMRAITRLGGNAGQVEESPIFLSLGRDNMNRSDLLTAQLDQIMLPFAGSLTDATDDDIAFEPLIVSSDAACKVDAMGAQFGVQAIRSQLKPDGLKHVLAARLSGKFKSAYPDGPPRDEAADGSNEVAVADSHLTACAEPNAMLIVGDSDFLLDRVSVRQIEVMFGFQSLQPINDNLALLANAVEKLSGGADLISIRSRGRGSRPFAKVDELEYRAMMAWQAEEKKLNDELQSTQQQLAELQKQKSGSQKLLLSKEQEDAIRRFREQEISVKAQLKQVRKNLRQDIERLGAWVKAVNIAGVPLLVALLGVFAGVARRRAR